MTTLPLKIIKKIDNRTKKTRKKIFNLLKNIYIKRTNRCLVLYYHRVINLENDPQKLAVTPKIFEEQLMYLKNNFNIIKLQDLVDSLNDRNISIPEKSCVITFDDGYFDNYQYALEILKKHNIPATIFVSTGFIGSNKISWWDQLERIFLSGNSIEKNSLELLINNIHYFWEIKNINDLKKIYEELHPLLKYLEFEDRDKIINYLIEWSGLGDKDIDRYRMIDKDELLELAKEPLIEIGAHTINHPVLSVESIDSQKKEIIQSKTILEDLVGKEIKSFSFPFGGTRDYTRQSIKIVKKAGYNCALTTNNGLVAKYSNSYLIPREVVRNWNLNHFKHYIDLYYNKKDLFDPLFEYFDKITGYIRYENKTKKIYNNILLPAIKRFPRGVKQNESVKNILQVNIKDQVGGAAIVSSNLHREFLKKKYCSKMLVSNPISNDDNIDSIEEDNSLDHYKMINRSKRKGWMDFFYLESFNLKNYDYFKNADIIHYHALHGYYFSPFALTELTALKPSVWTLHDMQAFTGHCAHSLDCDKWSSGCGNCPYLKVYPPLMKDTTDFLWKIKSEIYKNSNLTIICPSDWLKKKAEKSMLKDKDIRLVYNGVDTEKYKPINKNEVRKALGLPLNKTILSFVANIGKKNDWKGSQYIVESYKRLKDKYDILFLNIGKRDTSFHVDESWIDVPYIHDEKTLVNYYNASDLLLYPSLADNCPLVVLEALGCGVPIVAFKTGGVPELINHMETGYLSEYKDIEDFIKGISIFLKDKALLNNAKNRSRKIAIEKFSLDSMVDNYIKVYNDVFKNF